MSINVVIVEDDSVVRESLSEIISSESDLNCIASFSNAEEFTLAFPHLKVDVVLMDIHLPQLGGIETVQRLKANNSTVQFLMCTSFDDPLRIYDSLKAGATGYLLKNASPDKLRDAIREIHNGGSPMSPEIARLVVASFNVKEKENALLSSFNPKEQEILLLLSKGFQYKEIAERVDLSIDTVRSYIRDIYEKLQVHSRTEAINKVFQ